MRQIILSLLVILLFSNIFTQSIIAQESVIVAVKKEKLTTLQELSFDSLKIQIYQLNEVNFFRKIYPHVNKLNRYYHISCSDNSDSIFTELNSSRLFQTVFYDSISAPCCDDPIFADDAYDTTYVQDLISLPCAWDISIGDTSLKIGIVDRDFYSSLHEDIDDKVNAIYGPFPDDKRSSFGNDNPNSNELLFHGLKMADMGYLAI